MGLEQKFESLFNRGRAEVEKRLNRNQNQQPAPSNSVGYPGASGPPPIPFASKPGQPSNAYFQPVFDPAQPVTQNFRHEVGAHGWGNNELQNYVDGTVNSFHTPDGLVLRAIANTNSANDKYTSARLTSHQTLSRDRGCLTVRLTPPCAQGIWPAFWLLPQDPFSWPKDGEVDIFESWNGDRMNHSCLHWGFYNGEDAQKHRVVESHIPDMDRQSGHTFAFAWDQPPNGPGGRMVWYIDGRPAMKAGIPDGTRRLSDYRIIANVAVGGNVCGGKVPADGSYDLIIHELRFEDQPAGGWTAFDQAWNQAPEGHGM